MTPRVVFTRNPDLPDPAPDCRPATAGRIGLVVADPANRDRIYDRVAVGTGGYAIAVVPVGKPFVLVVTGDGAAAHTGQVSPVYRLPAARAQRQPISLRLFVVEDLAMAGTPAPGIRASPVPDGQRATPGAGTPIAGAGTQAITLLGVVCASDTLAGTYAYLPGLDEQGALPDATGTCRRATVGEMEFLLLDNTEANRLYDDALTGPDGVAVASAPVGWTFFVTEFQDDPDPATGLASGSQAILIPADAADRSPVALTVIRYVAPTNVGLPAGTLFLSTVACPPGQDEPALTVLGPDPSILLVPPGTPLGAAQPGSGRGCAEVGADYVIKPYAADDDATIEMSDGVDDGALLLRLPATVAEDGTRAFAPYELTERSTGVTVAFDIQEGRYTSVRSVLVDAPGTPAASGGAGSSSSAGSAPAGEGTAAASSGPGTPPAPDPAITPGTPPDPTVAPDTDDGNGGGLAPIRVLWAILALLGIAVFLAGMWVIRRPGGRASRR
ncbi:MAG TPA: hypothetical protein VGT61_14855 [Thermomicrobiales bacterium]|nr:hypothetical protein [Thermomicrobiales bacterium]